MTYVVTYVDVEPGSTNQAIGLLTQHRNTGIVLQETFRQNRFVTIETWEDEASFQVHESAEHTAQFRSKLRDIHNSPCDQRVHHGFSVGQDSGSAGPGTLCVVTHVDVPPPRRDETEVLLKTLAEQGRKGDGSVRYDVFQQNAPRTNHFTVFAVWNDEKAFALHEMKPHTRQFREALGPMLGAPYDERLYQPLV